MGVAIKNHLLSLARAWRASSNNQAMSPVQKKEFSLLATSQVISDTQLSLRLMFICIVPFIIQPHCCMSSLVLSHLKKQLRWLTVLTKDRNYFSMLPYSAFPNLLRSIWQTKTFQKASKLSVHYSILPFYKQNQKANLKLEVSFFVLCSMPFCAFFSWSARSWTSLIFTLSFTPLNPLFNGFSSSQSSHYYGIDTQALIGNIFTKGYKKGYKSQLKGLRWIFQNLGAQNPSETEWVNCIRL